MSRWAQVATWVSIALSLFSIVLTAYNVGHAKGAEGRDTWQWLYDGCVERETQCRQLMHACVDSKVKP